VDPLCGVDGSLHDSDDDRGTVDGALHDSRTKTGVPGTQGPPISCNLNLSRIFPGYLNLSRIFPGYLNLSRKFPGYLNLSRKFRSHFKSESDSGLLIK
jgi:hypothetical protein